MPNHWSTKLVFAHKVSAAAREQLDAWVAGKKPTLCESAFPMPEILRHTESGGRRFQMPGGDEVFVTSWYSNPDTKEERLFTALEEAKLKKLGYKDWYDWANAVWDTKWGDYNWFCDGPRTYGFHSAWGPPRPEVFQWLADKFALTFEVYGHDEGESDYEFSGMFGPEKEKK